METNMAMPTMWCMQMSNPISVHWSAEDGEYVATHIMYPSLSWLEPDAHDAHEGMVRLVADIEREQATDLTGQIGLRRHGKTFISKAIEWCTDSTAHHDVLILPNGWCISGEPGGARYRQLTDYAHLDVSAYELNDEQRMLITRYAHAAIGTPYNYMVFPILLLHRITHIPIPTWVKAWLNTRPHEDCSSLTNLIHTKAGVHLIPHGKLTTPGDYERDMIARGWLQP